MRTLKAFGLTIAILLIFGAGALVGRGLAWVMEKVIAPDPERVLFCLGGIAVLLIFCASWRLTEPIKPKQ